jgi:TolB-like protein
MHKTERRSYLSLLKPLTGIAVLGLITACTSLNDQQVQAEQSLPEQEQIATLKEIEEADIDPQVDHQEQVVEVAEQQITDKKSERQSYQIVNVKIDKFRDEYWPDYYVDAASRDNQYRQRLGSYRHPALVKHVGDYVQILAQDLVGNMEYVNQQTPIGITHFALLGSDLQKTNFLGYQLAESLMHEIHKFRIPVIDYKAMDYLRVTREGDFLMSRDYLELSPELPIEYVLTGTLTRHQGGYLVNARILGLTSKAVVASASSFLPYYVVDALIGEEDETIDGVKIIAGD